MECSLETHVAKLRKKSRTLLTQLEENSWKVNQEIKKLCLQTIPLNRSWSQHSLRISEFWQLRNDSSGVAGALCPDYYSRSFPRVSASLPNMTMQRRLLLSSKKKEEDMQFRIPVKECYCNRQTRKMQLRSNRTKVKQASCKHCKSLTDLRPMAWVESNDNQPRGLSTPIGCETVRRVRKINYSPQSEFLQNKLSSTENLLDEKVQASLKCNSRFLSRYPSDAGDRVQNKHKPIHSVCRNIREEALNELNDESDSCNPAEVSRKISYHNEICSHVSREFPINSKKPSRETLAKRTISSKKTLSTSANAQSQKTKTGNHFTSKGRARSSQSMISNKHQSHETFYDEDYFGGHDVIPKYLKHAKEFKGKTSKDKIMDDDRENPMTNLYKFREQNYFDTHGSTHTLLSSESSGSLERYILNERLFPQPAGKIHRGDLVVTMPSCVTTQNKKIHYFPRYVVRQEKNPAINVKKKHTCPLTCHAIDVRTLKIHHPSNSLALRFQKGVP